MARVVLEDLGKAYRGPNGQPIHAVQGLSLVVEDGELLALVGPSGCGKTTTLRLVAGLEKADRGTISIGEKVVNTLAPKDRNLAMVFQNHALYPHLTVFENVAFGLTVRKIPKAEIETRVKQTAALLDLLSCLDRLPNALSGGQRQRVALGRAIVRRPELFLFDEPLSNLDAPLRAQMRREIAQLQRHLRVTTIYVTHDQAEAMALGDRIAVMNEGVLQQLAPPSETYREPANLFVARFIGSPPTNLLRGHVVAAGDKLCFRSGQDRGKPGPISVPIVGPMARKLVGHVGKQVVLGIRPEHIIPVPAGGATAPETAVPAAVRFVERFGIDTHVHLDVGPDILVACWRGDSFSFAAHEQIVVTFEMTKALFFDPASGAAIL